MKKIISIASVFIVLSAVFFFYQAENNEAKILFVGDMMFDRYIRQVGYEKGEDYVFSCINNFLKDSDLVVGNLEGPITENASVSMFTTPGGDGNYTFTFPTNTAKLLAKNNIKLVNLGNNHIGNFGSACVASTKKYLGEAGVNYLGQPIILEDANENAIFRTKIAGKEISFISFNEFPAFGQTSQTETVQETARKISEEKSKGRIVFVYAHWGDEYSEIPERVKNMAKLFADSGADLIIGSHPHVILPSDIIKTENSRKVYVYYSLGNFIFDQYWNSDVSTGLVLEINIRSKSPGDWKIVEHKVSINRDGRTCLKN